MSDADFEKAKEAVKRVDRTHLAFMCKSFTLARRTDSHGAVDIIRSDRHPLGWGHPLAEQVNKLAERVAALRHIILEAGGSFSLEHPWDSFAWDHPALRKILKVDAVLLNQCAYGAESVKPTAIVSNARWILTVKGMCKEVAPHYHLKRGLTGKVFDPNVTKVLDAMVLSFDPHV